jgi:CbiX
MTLALIDNGSLEPAAHENLRRVARILGERTGQAVEAVSWKHSDRIAADQLGGRPAWTLAAWVRDQLGRGNRDFLFVPFFISPQGSIGSALRQELDGLRSRVGDFTYRFTRGLADTTALEEIAFARTLEVAAGLDEPAVVVVDHGGPSAESARIRDRIAGAVRHRLAGRVREVQAASMESPEGEAFRFNRPLLAEVLSQPPFDVGNVVITPLFLSPGRHAGPEGDLAQIARTATSASPRLRCHFTGLIGTHARAAEALAEELTQSLLSPSTP